jgi:hypothetical protein
LKRAVGTASFLAFALLVWSLWPLIAIGGNAVFRPGYQVRDLASEYRARLFPNRVRWHELKVYRMDCTPGNERRVVVLHTSEFRETPVDFLTRRFPECSGFGPEQSEVPAFFSGILAGRW